MRSRRRNVVNFLAREEADDSAEIASVPQTMPATSSSKSKSKKSRKKDSPESPDKSRVGLFGRMRQSIYRPRYLLLLAGGIFLLIFGPDIPKWLPDPGDRDEYQFETANIEINPPPRDVPPNLVRQVIERASLEEKVSIVDDDLTKQIAEAFAAHPWVEEVVSVQKSFPPRVVVELKYRRAIAMVEVDDGLYPISRDGILLPPEDFSLSDTRRYPLVRGVQTQPQGAAGTAWGDVSVAGAARLAVALEDDWTQLQLLAIVVPKRTSAKEKLEDLKFVLHTRGGSHILWGRAPKTSHPGELTATQKIGRLKKYLTDFGHFDRPHGPYEIDIRHWQEITRRRLILGRRDVERR